MTDENRVPAGCECPHCGEEHDEALVWIGDWRIRCSTCATEYSPTVGSGGEDADDADDIDFPDDPEAWDKLFADIMET